MTSCRRLSRVFLNEDDLPSPPIPAVLGVLGDAAKLSQLSDVLKTSGLKSGPKKVVPVKFAVDLGVETVVCGVRGVLGVALASLPKSSSMYEIFRFFL